MGKDRGDNTVQKDVVIKLQSVNNDFVACIGPLGTGKTVSVARIAVGALTQDQKIIVVGPAYQAADNAANAIWKEMSPELEESKNVMR